MKLTAKIVTGLAVLGLAAPAFAGTSTTSTPPAAQTQTVKHRHSRKVAQAQPKVEAKKSEKKSNKKHSAKKSEQGAKTEAPASAPAAPAAAPAPAPAK